MTQYLDLLVEVTELKQDIEELRVLRLKDARLIRFLLGRLDMQLPIDDPQNVTEQAAMDWYNNYGIGDKYDRAQTRYIPATGARNVARE